MSAQTMPRILPPTGIITFAELAKFLQVSDQTLIDNLKKENIPILKLGNFRRMWLIRLEDLHGTQEEVKEGVQ